MNPLYSADMQDSSTRQRSISLGVRVHPLATITTVDPNTPILIKDHLFTESPPTSQLTHPTKQTFNFEKLRRTLRLESNSPFKFESVTIRSVESPLNKSYNLTPRAPSSKHIQPIKYDPLSTEDSFRSNHPHTDRELTLEVPIYENIDVSELMDCSLDSVITHRLNSEPLINRRSHPDKGEINLSQEISQFSGLIDLSISVTDENVKVQSPRESLGNLPMTYSTVETLSDKPRPLDEYDIRNKEGRRVLGTM